MVKETIVLDYEKGEVVIIRHSFPAVDTELMLSQKYSLDSINWMTMNNIKIKRIIGRLE